MGVSLKTEASKTMTKNPSTQKGRIRRTNIHFKAGSGGKPLFNITLSNTPAEMPAMANDMRKSSNPKCHLLNDKGTM